MITSGNKPLLSWLAIGMALLLTACQGGIDGMFPKSEKPLPSKLVRKIKDKGMALTSPILVRIYKSENKLEVWKAKPNGRYAFLTDYEICKWSGKLGPKFKEGDRQAPEGFYMIQPAQMNPRSQYHLSFNMGFPNQFDRAHGRTGTHLMVHGACSSAGCYSMTDEYVEQIYGLARESFKGGQKAFQIQAYPFKMTPENLADHVNSPHFNFWKLLKEGSDHFEVTRVPPKVNVCDKKYVFNQVAHNGNGFHPSRKCPASSAPTSLALAYTKKAVSDQNAFVAVLGKKAASPFLSAEIRSAAKRQVEIEKAEKAKLQRRQAALVQKQQHENLEKRQAVAAANAEKLAQEEKSKLAALNAAALQPAQETQVTNVPQPVPAQPSQPVVKQATVEPVPSAPERLETPTPASQTSAQGRVVVTPIIQMATPITPPPPTPVAEVAPVVVNKPVKKKKPRFEVESNR